MSAMSAWRPRLDRVKDEDFHRLTVLHGPPPKVIWIRLGQTNRVSSGTKPELDRVVPRQQTGPEWIAGPSVMADTHPAVAAQRRGGGLEIGRQLVPVGANDEGRRVPQREAELLVAV